MQEHLGLLEEVMAAIENANADEMDAIRQTDEWKEAMIAAEKARNIQGQSIDSTVIYQISSR